MSDRLFNTDGTLVMQRYSSVPDALEAVIEARCLGNPLSHRMCAGRGFADVADYGSERVSPAEIRPWRTMLWSKERLTKP